MMRRRCGGVLPRCTPRQRLAWPFSMWYDGAMKISRKDVVSRRVDPSLEIVPLFDGTDFKFDVALGILNGDHGSRINRVSDRIYFILKGSLSVQVGSDTFEVSAHDTIVIPAGTSHGISGSGEYLVVTAPPFSPENEVDA